MNAKHSWRRMWYIMFFCSLVAMCTHTCHCFSMEHDKKNPEEACLVDLCTHVHWPLRRHDHQRSVIGKLPPSLWFSRWLFHGSAIAAPQARPNNVCYLNCCLLDQDKVALEEHACSAGGR
jgi:hypothetical protein